MSPETSSTKLCPTCGTRLAENATRCVVCGSEFTVETKPKSQKTIRGSQMPEIRLSLPAALGFLAVFLAIVALVVFLILRGNNAQATPEVTPTATPTITLTPTPTLLPTDTPTPTPLPPIEYQVRAGDTCYSIAAFFDVSANVIIQQNNLSLACTDLRVGQTLLIPRPTPTPLPPPTATLEPFQATIAACEKVTYTVQRNDTLSSIAANYNVPMDAIKTYNGLTTDNVYLGQALIIPLCERYATPGPSPTATLPPPYPAPNLLLPVDGQPFTLANDTVTLQWASVGTLRDNEGYQVTIEDVTDGTGRELVAYVTDTKYIVPVSFRPQDNLPHVMRWSVVVVRRTGTDDRGNPIWTPAGAVSEPRDFTWSGAGAAATPTR